MFNKKKNICHKGWPEPHFSKNAKLEARQSSVEVQCKLKVTFQVPLTLIVTTWPLRLNSNTASVKRKTNFSFFAETKII